MKYSVKTRKVLGKEPELNVYYPDLNLCQVFILDYYGRLVFFQISKVTAEQVRLVELETIQNEMGESGGVGIYDDYRLAKHPWFVKKNVFTKSEYWVTPREDGALPISIDYTSPIFIDAVRRGVSCPLVGTFYIDRVKEVRNLYFVSEYLLIMRGEIV